MTVSVETQKRAPQKKAWVQPRAETTPASAAALTPPGSVDGCCCHS
jgi:hypothetical protein